MIEILPENLANHVEKKCGSLAGELIPPSPIILNLPPKPTCDRPWNNFQISFPQSHAFWHLTLSLPPGTPDFFDVIGQVFLSSYIHLISPLK